MSTFKLFGKKMRIHKAAAIFHKGRSNALLQNVKKTVDGFL